MKASIRIVTCIVILVDSAGALRAKEWRGIRPLHSTRADVERLPGKPNLDGRLYDLEGERVSIDYSDGVCREGWWDVPPDTVVAITVMPEKRLKLSVLRVDVSKYEKSDGGHVPGYTYYTSKGEGVQIEVAGEDLASVTYFPSARDNGPRCRAPPDRS